MLSLFDRFTFRHGVHPPDSKHLTESVVIRRMPFPDQVVLPIRQHAGKQSLGDPLDDEGSADEAVGRPDEFHRSDEKTPRVDRKSDRICNQEDRRQDYDGPQQEAGDGQ